MEHTVNQKEKIILNIDEGIEVIPIGASIHIRRQPIRPVSKDSELLEKAEYEMAKSGAITGDIYERALDKLTHYYFHFLDHSDQKIKSFFYHKFIKLETDLVKLGNEHRFFENTKLIARASYSEAQRFSKNVKKTVTDNRMDAGKVSKDYDRLRKHVTPYGENISSVLSTLVACSSIHFY